MAPPAGACVPPQQVRVWATAGGQVVVAATVVEADEMGLPCDGRAGLTLVAGVMASGRRSATIEPMPCLLGSNADVTSRIELNLSWHSRQLSVHSLSAGNINSYQCLGILVHAAIMHAPDRMFRMPHATCRIFGRAKTECSVCGTFGRVKNAGLWNVLFYIASFSFQSQR
jgi:hypothetical protein